MTDRYLSEETLQYIEQLSADAKESCLIDPELYTQYQVKRGLRDISGRGVLAGLTEIADIHAYIISDDEMVPCPGKLYYRGINIKQLTQGFLDEDRFGFEETAYLLLFGKLPNTEELARFTHLLAECRGMRHGFVRDIIMKSPSNSIMNTMARSVLTLYSADEDPDMPMKDRFAAVWRRFPQAKIHWYGKGYCAGRKLGHVNVPGQDGSPEGVAETRREADLAAGYIVNAVWADGYAEK